LDLLAKIPRLLIGREKKFTDEIFSPYFQNIFLQFQRYKFIFQSLEVSYHLSRTSSIYFAAEYSEIQKLSESAEPVALDQCIKKIF